MGLLRKIKGIFLGAANEMPPLGTQPNSEIFGDFKQRVASYLQEGQVDALLALHMISGFTRYDLGPHQAQETIKFGKMFDDAIDARKIDFSESPEGEVSLLNDMLSDMREGDVRVNALKSRMDALVREGLKDHHAIKPPSAAPGR